MFWMNITLKNPIFLRVKYYAVKRKKSSWKQKYTTKTKKSGLEGPLKELLNDSMDWAQTAGYISLWFLDLQLAIRE